MSLTDPCPSYSITDAASDWTASGAVFETKTDAVARMEGDQKTYASAKWADKVSYSLEEVRQILNGALDIPGPLIVDNNITMGSASPTLTMGSGAGSVTHRMRKADAGTGDLAFQVGTTNRWIQRFDTSENMVWRRYDAGGVYQDDTFTLQSGGNAVFANTVFVAGAGSVIGASSATFGSNALNVEGSSGRMLLYDSTTDTANKNAKYGTAHYTNAEEPFFGVNMESTASNNLLRLGGGYSSGNAATQINFYAAANFTTQTGTLVGTFTSTLFDCDVAANFSGNVTLDGASSIVHAGDGTGSPQNRLQKGADGGSYFVWFTGDKTASLGDYRQWHDSGELWHIGSHSGSAWEKIISLGDNKIGFFAATPVAKPTVSGARDDPEAALADLLSELATMGLITDSTTAS